jgi:hypothetical protein
MLLWQKVWHRCKELARLRGLPIPARRWRDERRLGECLAKAIREVDDSSWLPRAPLAAAASGG